MLNPEKVELMSRIKVAEQGRKKSALLNKSYFEGKSSVRILTSTLFGICAYVLLLVLAYLLFGRNILDFTQRTALSVILLVVAAAVGACFVIVYVKVIKIILYRRYRDTRSALVKYDILKRNQLRLKEKNNSK